MRSLHHIRQLSELKDICAVQQMDLDMQVVRAQTCIRALEDRRHEETNALATCQDGWRNSVAGRSFDLMASAFWSVEIQGVEAKIESISTEIQMAIKGRERLVRLQAVAAARHNALDGLISTERRRIRSRREEARLEAHALSGSTGWGRP